MICAAVSHRRSIIATFEIGSMNNTARWRPRNNAVVSETASHREQRSIAVTAWLIVVGGGLVAVGSQLKIFSSVIFGWVGYAPLRSTSYESGFAGLVSRR